MGTVFDQCIYLFYRKSFIDPTSRTRLWMERPRLEAHAGRRACRATSWPGAAQRRMVCPAQECLGCNFDRDECQVGLRIEEACVGTVELHVEVIMRLDQDQPKI